MNWLILDNPTIHGVPIRWDPKSPITAPVEVLRRDEGLCLVQFIPPQEHIPLGIWVQKERVIDD